MKPFAIHLSGPAGSGKSYFSAALGKKFPGLYQIEFDKLKWQLAGYHRDSHSDLIKEIELGMFEVICKKKLPATVDYFCENESEYNACKKIADDNSYIFVPIQLTAPKEVLLERFRKRVERAKKTERRISFTDESLLHENFSRKSYIPKNTRIFDTANTPVSQIVDQVIEMVQQLS